MARCFDNNECKELLRARGLFSEQYYIQIIFFIAELTFYL